MMKEAINALERGYRSYPDDEGIFTTLRQYYMYTGFSQKLEELEKSWKARHPGEELPPVRHFTPPDAGGKAPTSDGGSTPG